MTSRHNSYAGGVPMVQIDGGKIRSFREKKELTQLYLATAVEVTTDTISRWENRRYPTIKKENAIKLAEALEVDLEAILDTGQDLTSDDGSRPAGDPLGSDADAQSSSSEKKGTVWLITIVVAMLVIVAWFVVSQFNGVQIEAVRFMPAHTAPGQPFPVVIKIVSSESKPSPFILREMLPVGTTLVESQKSIPAAVDHKTGEMKWISKVTEKMVLGYSLSFNGPISQDGLNMKGAVTLRRFAGKAKVVAGNNRIKIAPFHWADTNKDRYIDDLEILAVYEDYSDATGLDLEMDLIEDIWFGNGYEWNDTELKFEIIP